MPRQSGLKPPPRIREHLALTLTAGFVLKLLLILCHVHCRIARIIPASSIPTHSMRFISMAIIDAVVVVSKRSGFDDADNGISKSDDSATWLKCRPYEY